MANESEVNLLGTALGKLEDSTDPDDQHVANLISAALRLRGDRGDIIYPLLNAGQNLSAMADTREASELTSAQKRIEPPQYYPAIPLPDELERQREEATERIAVPLGIDRNKFLAKLPTRFPDRKSAYDRFCLNIPLIDPNLTSFGLSWLQAVEGTLFYNPNHPEQTLKAYVWSELKNRIGELKVWRDPRRGVEPFPEVPHAVWIQDGSRYVNGKPKDVRKQLQKIGRAGDHWKGLGLSVLRPDMVQTMWWDLIGGQVASDYVPYVRWDDAPKFRYGRDDNAVPGYRALVCGSEYTEA